MGSVFGFGLGLVLGLGFIGRASARVKFSKGLGYRVCVGRCGDAFQTQQQLEAK